MQAAKVFHDKCLDKTDRVTKPESKLDFDSLCCMCLRKNTKNLADKSICEYCVKKRTEKGVDERACDLYLDSVRVDVSTGLVNSCSNYYQFYNVNEHHSVCCKESVHGSSSSPRRNTDPYVVNGAKMLKQLYLSKLTLQKTKSLLSLQDLFSKVTTTKDLNRFNFTGLQCRTNRTIGFYYVDSVYQSVFMDRIRVPTQHSKPSVILVDLQDESTYTMKHTVTYSNLGMVYFARLIFTCWVSHLWVKVFYLGLGNSFERVSAHTHFCLLMVIHYKKLLTLFYV